MRAGGPRTQEKQGRSSPNPAERRFPPSAARYARRLRLELPHMSKPAVFVSYSHRDREWKDRLVHHLVNLERGVPLDLWEESRFASVKEGQFEIEEALARARVVVLLISAEFLRSDGIRDPKVQEILARRKAQGVHVFPILLEHCPWYSIEELTSISPRPSDRKVLAEFRDFLADSELVKIAREILHLTRVVPSASRATPPLPLSRLDKIPSPPGDFVGRAEDLAALRASLKIGGATICGADGVGKTALALALAKEMAEKFPDGLIYLDLQGASERPSSPSDAMAHVIRCFGGSLPRGTLLAEVYRDTLAGRRVLLLMDNASGHDQVATLQPPAGCALLVTSRRKFKLHRLVLWEVQHLAEEDACELLLGIAERIGNRAHQIARRCGYLPFALRIAASSLAERPEVSVEALVTRLGEETEAAAIGKTVIEIGLSLLPEAFQQRFRHLAVFAGDFDTPAAGAVWGLGEEETERTLGAFVHGSLLEGRDERYKLHDLARAFAASRRTEEEKATGELRHAEHYCGVLDEADRLCTQGLDYEPAGLALFDREWHQIVAGQAWAAENLHKEEEAARLASEYPAAGVYVLDFRLPRRQRVAWLEAGRAGAQRAGDRETERFHLRKLSFLYNDLLEIRRAIDAQEAWLALSREIGDRRDELSILKSLGVAYENLGETRRAIEYFERFLATAREIGDRIDEGVASWFLGSAYASLGELARAVELMQVYLDLMREEPYVDSEEIEEAAAQITGIRLQLAGA